MAAFVYIWEYRVHPDHLDAFLASYGRDGDWARFFARDPAWLRTELLRDDLDAARFITVDYWTSREARDAYRAAHDTEFQAIDERCGGLTEYEIFLGDFVVADEAAGAKVG
jgi:quinol monooxygenase YgiN